MRNSSSRLALAGSLLGLSLLLPACLIGSHRDVDSSGTYISDTTFEQVRPGQSSQFVLELFGEPTQRITTESYDGESAPSEIWKWSYSKVTNDNGSVFLIVNAKTTTRSDGNVFVEIRDDKVVKTWRD